MSKSNRRTAAPNNLILADMTPTSAEKGVAVPAGLPYDTPVRDKVVTTHPVTRKEGVAPIVRTDYK